VFCATIGREADGHTRLASPALGLLAAHPEARGRSEKVKVRSLQALVAPPQPALEPGIVAVTPVL
jgi:hypothetical protein